MVISEQVSEVLACLGKAFVPLVTMSVIAANMTQVGIVDSVAQAAVRSAQFDEFEELL